MFPLWRKRRTFVLLPDRVLCGEGRDPMVVERAEAGSGASAEALFAALGDALGDAVRAHRRKPRVTLVVSDSFAAIVALPWQPALLRAAEVDQYAEAQFERSGQPLGAGWAMYSYFRHYGASGMAYAFPADFVQRLQEVAAAHGATIDAIVPLSGFAYARLQRSRKGSRALLVRESSRVSALVANRNGLATYATEPVVADGARAVKRLLRRLQAEYALEQIAGFVLQADDATALLDTVERVAPSARCVATTLDLWRT